MGENTSVNFWSVFGKLAVLVGFFWSSTQIYNWITDNNGFDFTVIGNHSKYELAPKHIQLLLKYEDAVLYDKAYREEISSTGLSLNKQTNFSKETSNADYLENYKYNKKFHPIFSETEYNYTWEFQIENNGKQPLEELNLETPFEGAYSISDRDGNEITGVFNKNIELPDLLPGYKLGVRVWINEVVGYDIYNEEKTRITHKYGYKPVSYSKKVNGLVKWVVNNDIVYLLSVPILLILFMLTFQAGINYYPKYEKQEKERKIKEIREQEELKAQLELEEKEKDNDDIDKDLESQNQQ